MAEAHGLRGRYRLMGVKVDPEKTSEILRLAEQMRDAAIHTTDKSYVDLFLRAADELENQARTWLVARPSQNDRK
jgi:hypothetical protein